MGGTRATSYFASFPERNSKECDNARRHPEGESQYRARRLYEYIEFTRDCSARGGHHPQLNRRRQKWFRLSLPHRNGTLPLESLLNICYSIQSFSSSHLSASPPKVEHNSTRLRKHSSIQESLLRGNFVATNLFWDVCDEQRRRRKPHPLSLRPPTAQVSLLLILLHISYLLLLLCPFLGWAQIGIAVLRYEPTALSAPFLPCHCPSLGCPSFLFHLFLTIFMLSLPFSIIFLSFFL